MSVLGRATQGNRLIDLKKRNDVISSVCLVPADEQEENEEVEATEVTTEGEATTEATTETSATDATNTAEEDQSTDEASHGLFDNVEK